MRTVLTVWALPRSPLAFMAAAVIITICASSAWSQENRVASIAVQVFDQQGGVIVRAQATLKDTAGKQTSGITNQEGKFVFSDLAPGNYALRISAEYFKTYENPQVQAVSGRDINVNAILNLAGVEESIAVYPDTSVSQLAEYVGGSLVIRGDALLALNGPGGLEAFLRALALRTSGPFGPTALVNGFEDSQLPPTYSIREIRINDNPFSAEYSTLGLGRIEILTKPGTEALHGSAFGSIGDADFNSRNPFAPNKAPYQSRMYGGNVSGPLLPKRAAYFLDFNRMQIDTNAVINATIVDSESRIVPFSQAVVTPYLRNSFSARLDYQMGAKHTWVLRYSQTPSRARNSRVGEFSLLSRAQDSNDRIETAQLTETAVLSSRTINEIRAQLVRTKTTNYGNDSMPTINVPGAFIGGGADNGPSYDRQNLGELQNILSWQAEKHVLKVGVQGRYTIQANGSTQNFGGTYTFASRIAPLVTDEIAANPDGTPVLEPITDIESYRRTVLLLDKGFPPEKVRELGGGASQFSIATGTIQTRVGQYQTGAFLQDNWRLHPNFTLSAGLRYERQANISRKTDFAPRLAFAWGIGGGNTAPKTIVRGGTGVFYDRVGESIFMRARQLDGFHQQQYFISDNSFLDLFPAVPTRDALARFGVAQSTVHLAGDLRAPYTVNSSLAVERQVMKGLTVAVTASRLRGVHLLRSRDINAPIPGTYDPSSPQTALRPFRTSAEIFQYESGGVMDQRQLLLNVVYQAAKNVTIWSTYTLSNSKTDTDSPDEFPANSYDLHSEYGRSATQARHTFYWGGWIGMKWGIDFTPLVLWRSQVPFNITTGSDANGDSLFTDRPAFATDLTRPSVTVTQFGAFDLSPMPGQRIIPRNFGNSLNFFIANLRVGKRIPLNKQAAFTLSIQGTNIFNHTNPGAIIGNLGSPLFGTSNTSAGDWGLGSNQAGNRRLETMLNFTF